MELNGRSGVNNFKQIFKENNPLSAICVGNFFIVIFAPENLIYLQTYQL